MCDKCWRIQTWKWYIWIISNEVAQILWKWYTNSKRYQYISINNVQVALICLVFHINVHLTWSTGRSNKWLPVVLMNLLQVREASQVNCIHTSGTLVLKNGHVYKVQRYALSVYILYCITCSSSTTTCFAAVNCYAYILSKNRIFTWHL